jgi:fatty-acyl-CoA synthase/long-chain acyl-CoA synthetase
LTEASPVLTQTDQHDRTDDPSASVGRPLPHTELLVVDPDDRTPVGVGGIGEVMARGPQIMDGYAGDPAATGRAIDADGWLRTGDMGWLDADGRLHIEGRLDDVITRHGQRWLPAVVERALVEVAGVAEAVVVGSDPAMPTGEVVAFVRLHQDGPADEHVLRTIVAEACGPDRVPDRIVVLNEFPALPSGKVRRFVLREMASSLS